MTRRVAYVLSLVVVLAAALVVPMPFYEVQPGSAHPVEGMLSISAATGDVDGDLSLLTTRQRTPNALQSVWVGLHPDRELEPAAQRTPGEIELDQYFDIQRSAFDNSLLTAVSVAAREAGHDVQLQTRTVVAQVLPDGPSAGLLRPGDTITAIDGVPTDSAVAVVDELRRSDEERPVAVEVDRGGDPVTVTVELRRLPETEHPALGILVETIAEQPDLPFDVDLEDADIVGPSAGLMFALTTADLLLEEDLAAGRVIAGTGTIAPDGTVGQVSGVAQKTRAAIEAGADLLLVPVEQLPEASAAAEAGIEVVGVRSFRDALDALRGTATGVAAPG